MLFFSSFLSSHAHSKDEQKELRESKKNSQDDNIDLLKEEALKQNQFADDANDYKNECEARLQEILKAVEKLYK
jgi:hypothetical protein